MADETEKSFKAFKSWQEETEKANETIKDFYDHLEDAFDISKKITNQYDKTYKSIQKSNGELESVNKQIIANLDAIADNSTKIAGLDKSILENRNKQSALLQAEEKSKSLILGLEENIAHIQRERDGIQQKLNDAIEKEKKEIVKIDDIKRRILKNDGAIKANSDAIVASRSNLLKVENQIKATQQEELKLRNSGPEYTAQYETALNKINALQRKKNELSEKDSLYQKDAARLLERESKLSDDLFRTNEDRNTALAERLNLQLDIDNLNKKEKSNLEGIDIFNKGIVTSLKQRKELSDEEITIEKKLNVLNEERVKLNLEQNSLSERQINLTEKISKLQMQLNFWKLIQMGYERFVALDKAAEDFRRSTGFSNTQMVELRKNAESVNVELQEFGVSIEQAYSAAKALTDVFGNTSLVTKEAMTNVALMNANLNVAVEDSAAVLATFQGLGGATQEAAMNMMKIGAGLSEKAGVPFSLVMKDIANASEQTTALLGANPSKLMKSAIAARALGTDMNKIVASQRKLLDYSSSMNDELELSALLGRSISFQKSRQLAYDGDIAGAAKATLETVKAAGDFDKMSVYQREALAKASGMELKDLTKMMAVDKQREEIMLGGDQAAKDKLKLQDETLKKLEEENDLSKQGLLADGEKAIRQQKMQGQMTKMKNIMESLMVSIGDVLEPIITMLSEVVVPVFGFVAKVLRGVLEPISWIAKGIGFIFDSTTSWSKASEKVGEQFKDWKTRLLTVAKILGALLLTATLLGKVGVGGLMKTITSPLKTVKDFGKNMLGKLTGKGAASDLIRPKLPDASAAGDGVGKAAKATENVKSGTGVKDFLTNLAAGLKEMGNAKVLFGAFNLIPASIGLIAMIPGFFGAKLLEKIDGDSLKSSMTGLAEGLEKMGTGSVAKGSLVMILAGVGFAAMTVGAIGLGAVALFGVAAGVGLTGLAVGLAALGNPVVGLGVLILMGVSLAFVGIAYAIKLASEAFINIAKILPEIIVPLMQFAILSPLLYIAAGSIGALALSFGMLAAMTLPALVAAAAVYIIAKSVNKLGDSFEKTANGISLFSKTAVSIINPIKQLATANLKDAATGISSLGAALSAFGTGSAVAGIGSFIGNFLGGDPIAKMEKLASIGDKLKITADSISAIAQATSQFRAIDVFAESVTKLATSLGKLNDELGKIKSEELSKLSQISSAAGATSKTEENKSMKVDNSGIEAKLDKLTDLLVGGAIRVYMDGTDVSSAISSRSN